MRTLFLAFATSAAILATGVTPVTASEYRYCLHGDDFAATGDCGFTSYQQCQATASGRAAMCEINPFFAYAQIPPGAVYRRPYRSYR